MSDKNTEVVPELSLRKSGLSNTTFLLIVTISLFIILYVTSLILFWEDNFFYFSMFFNTFFNEKPYLLAISLALTVVMICGSIDISVGGVVGLVAMVISVMLLNPETNAVWTIFAALGIGLAFGVTQGFLIAYLRIQPFIVTLVGMVFARGMITVIRPTSVPITTATSGGETFLNWSSAQLTIPFLFNVRPNGRLAYAYLVPAGIIVLLVLIIVIFLLKYTRFGRSLYAVGGNSHSALLMGISPARTKFFAHVLAGVLAGIGGLAFTLVMPGGSPDYGRTYEIQAISSSIIGGAMLSGGVGLPIGTFFGVLINLLIQRVVPLLGLTEASWPHIITSIFLLGFIVLQSIMTFATKKEGGLKSIFKWLIAFLFLKRKEEQG